jgi:hypothetical protein
MMPEPGMKSARMAARAVSRIVAPGGLNNVMAWAT